MSFTQNVIKPDLTGRLVPTAAAVAVVLLAAWMGHASGGYFTSYWALAAFIVAALALLASLGGVFRHVPSRWNAVALGLFAAYTLWTFCSILWSPNRGEAWLGAGQTLLYFLAFWTVSNLVTLEASRRWVLAASVLGPTVVALLTWWSLESRATDLFENSRLIGTVGYYNGEAAFLLVPFWAAIYLAGSRRVNVALRGAVLAGAVLCIDLAVLTQSRGAMVAVAVSLPVFFLLSGQRLRGALALLPVAVGLLVAFPHLNGVYTALLDGSSASTAIEDAVPVVWLCVAGALLYGLLWGVIDRYWRPPALVVRVAGSLMLACVVVLLAVGLAVVNERVEDPAAFVEQKWQAFKTNDQTGGDTSRYLSVSGQGRYVYWQVAWKDFVSHPLLGVGTHNYEATYYQLREQVAGWVRQPHMLPLEVLAERGIVGGVLFFGFVGTCLAAGLWKRFLHLSSEGKAQVGAITASVTYWFVHSSADWFWQLPAVTLPAIVYLGALVAPWRTSETAALGWPLRAAGAVVATAAVVAIAPLYIADRYFVQSQLNPNPWEALASLERAQQFNPVDPRLPQQEAELALTIGDWPRVDDAYNRAIELNPRHFGTYKLLALFHEKAGNTQEARELYDKALALNPLDEDLKRRTGQPPDATP